MTKEEKTIKKRSMNLRELTQDADLLWMNTADIRDEISQLRQKIQKLESENSRLSFKLNATIRPELNL